MSRKIIALIFICIFYSGYMYADCDLIIGLNEVDISNLDKAKVLQALYKHAKPQGSGCQHYTEHPLEYEQAKRLLQDGGDGFGYFSYIGGRVLHVNLSGNTLNTWLYNRDNGANAAEKAICELFHQSSHYPRE